MVAGCNYIRATHTSCCYLCWNVCWNHCRIFQWNSLSNVWFSQCLPACRVFLGLCVKLQTCRVITSVCENLQCKQEARTAVSFLLHVSCSVAVCVLQTASLQPCCCLDGGLHSLQTDWEQTGKWKRGLHISYSFTRSFFLVVFVLSDEGRRKV